jgi:hypothetical protein
MQAGYGTPDLPESRVFPRRIHMIFDHERLPCVLHFPLYVLPSFGAANAASHCLQVIRSQSSQHVDCDCGHRVLHTLLADRRSPNSRRRTTKGDIERRMAANPPEGFSFVSCNWKKRKAKFVNTNGQLKFVAF